jgi:ribosomal protein S18 acetylase RimI-like enzyme
MRIKDVKIRDLKKIMILERDIFKKNAFSEELMTKLILRNIFFLKLENNQIGNPLIGFIIVIKDQIDRVNIINFLIHTNFQCKGLGTVLLKNVINKIKQLKEIRKVVLNVQESNLGAINLYKKFNFIMNPKIIKNYYQSGENAFLMELYI